MSVYLNMFDFVMMHTVFGNIVGSLINIGHLGRLPYSSFQFVQLSLKPHPSQIPYAAF